MLDNFWHQVFTRAGMLCENGLLCEGGCAADGIADDACSAPEYSTPEVLASNTIEEKWLYAFPWAIGIITSYAPFDLRATRPVESIFVCAALLVGMLINAAIISSTTSAYPELRPGDAPQDGREGHEHYLRFHGVKSSCRTRSSSTYGTRLGRTAHSRPRPRYCTHRSLAPTSRRRYYRYLCISSQSLEDLRTFRDLPPQLWLHSLHRHQPPAHRHACRST